MLQRSLTNATLKTTTRRLNRSRASTATEPRVSKESFRKCLSGRRCQRRHRCRRSQRRHRCRRSQRRPLRWRRPIRLRCHTSQRRRPTRWRRHISVRRHRCLQCPKLRVFCSRKRRANRSPRILFRPKTANTRTATTSPTLKLAP